MDDYSLLMLVVFTAVLTMWCIVVRQARGRQHESSSPRHAPPWQFGIRHLMAAVVASGLVLVYVFEYPTETLVVATIAGVIVHFIRNRRRQATAIARLLNGDLRPPLRNWVLYSSCIGGAIFLATADSLGGASGVQWIFALEGPRSYRPINPHLIFTVGALASASLFDGIRARYGHRRAYNIHITCLCLAGVAQVAVALALLPKYMDMLSFAMIRDEFGTSIWLGWPVSLATMAVVVGAKIRGYRHAPRRVSSESGP